MVRLALDTVIARPVEEVFAYFADLDNRPEWIGVLERVVRTSDGPPAVGMRWREVNRMLGRQLTVDLELIEYEHNRQWVDRVSSGPVPMVIAFTFEPANGGTLVRGTIEAQIRGLVWLVAPVVVRTLRREFRDDMGRLKAMIEAKG